MHSPGLGGAWSSAPKRRTRLTVAARNSEVRGQQGVEHHGVFRLRGRGVSITLLLDSRVVDVARSCHPIFITVSSLKPFLFNDLIHEWRFVDRMEA